MTTATPLPNLSVKYSSGSLNINIERAWPSYDDLVTLCSIAPDNPPDSAGVHWPGLAAMHNAGLAIGKAIMALFADMLKIVGLGLDAIQAAWESFIGAAVKLSDIVAGNWADIKAAVKKAWVTPEGKKKMSWLPSPLFGTVNSEGVSISHIVYELCVNAYLFVVEQITTAAAQFSAAFAGAMPTIPTPPTMARIRELLIEGTNKVGGSIQSSWEDLKTVFKNELGVISAAIDAIPPLPKPLIPKSSAPSVEVETAKTNFMMMILKAIGDWINTNIITPIATFLAQAWPPGLFPIGITLPIGVLMTAAIAIQIEKYGGGKILGF